MPNYQNLLSYCKSDRQIEIFNSLIKHNSQTKASQELDINLRSLKEVVSRVKNQASKQGYDPDHDMTHPIPMHMGLQRVSTNYDDEGNVRQQWVIQKPGAEAWSRSRSNEEEKHEGRTEGTPEGSPRKLFLAQEPSPKPP